MCPLRDKYIGVLVNNNDRIVRTVKLDTIPLFHLDGNKTFVYDSQRYDSMMPGYWITLKEQT